MAEQTDEPAPIPRIMICVDHTHNAEAAFDHYFDRLHRYGNQVLIAHAEEDTSVAAHVQAVAHASRSVDVPTPDAAVEYEAKVKRKTEAIKEKYHEKCEKVRIRYHFKAIPDNGKGVGPTICEYARNHNVDLIVLGSKGMDSLRRAFHGSVGDYVLHHSHRPTLICPKRK